MLGVGKENRSLALLGMTVLWDGLTGAARLRIRKLTQ
jgi:hypothetical protein